MTEMSGHPVIETLTMARRIANSLASVDVTCPARALIDNPACSHGDCLPSIGGWDAFDAVF